MEQPQYIKAALSSLPQRKRNTPITQSNRASLIHSNAPQKYKPFLIDVLPEPVRAFVEAGAAAIGCDAAFLALPMLSVLGGTIGNSVRLKLRRSWKIPPNVWTMCIGESGSAKSPALRLVLQPLHMKQGEAMVKHEYAMEEFEALLARWEREFSVWKRSKIAGDPPEKPIPPVAPRVLVNDSTLEAIVPILSENPRGILLARDELAGWLGSFDKYSKSGSADAAHWLSMFNAEPITVDRKTGQPKTIYVPSAFVAITGTIQPGVLHRMIGHEHRESGMLARFILACPPAKTKRWTEADVDQTLEDDFAHCLDFLRQHFHLINNEPTMLELSPDAKKHWIDFYNQHGEEMANQTGDLASSYSKFEEYALRFALIFHCVKYATSQIPNQTFIETDSLANAIKLVEWCKHETTRVYELLSEEPDQKKVRRLIEWIERKGGSVTMRDTQRGPRWLRTNPEFLLNGLAESGIGSWRDRQNDTGGRPTREFVLNDMTET